LQYKADGHPDRLPEKILELGSNSVAFVSDVIPGKPWVLRVTHDSGLGLTKPQAPKSTWSRLTFRGSEVKRIVKDFLLIFDGAERLDAWMTAIRKEIEALGGLEYRPDTPEHERVQEELSRMPSQRNRSSPVLSLTAFDSACTTPYAETSHTLVPSTHPLMPRKSITNSSVATSTELDGLRGSSFSDHDSAFTGTRSSIDGSTASASSAIESFTDMKQRTRQASQTWISAADMKRSPIVDPMTTFVFPADNLVPRAGAHIPKSPSHLSPGMLSGNTIKAHNELLVESRSMRPISTIAPLPSPGLIKRPPHHRNKGSADSLERVQTVTIPRPVTSYSTHSQSSGQSDATNRASYSLFPRRLSSLDYKNAALACMPSPPSSVPESVMSGYFPKMDAPIAPPPPAGLKMPVKPVGKFHSRKPVSMSITTGSGVKTAEPERTPAVTSAHLTSNFGIDLPNPDMPTPMNTPIYGVVPSTRNKTHRLPPQKSLPNMSFSAVPPVGPPPSGPLPALPRKPTHSRKPSSKSKKKSLRVSAKINSTNSDGSSPQTPNSPKHTRTRSSAASIDSASTRTTPPTISRPATSAGENIHSTESTVPTVPFLPMPARFSPLMGLNFSMPRTPEYTNTPFRMSRDGQASSVISHNLPSLTTAFPTSTSSSTFSSPNMIVAPLSHSSTRPFRQIQHRTRSSVSSIESGVLGVHHVGSRKAGVRSRQSRCKSSVGSKLTGIEKALLAAMPVPANEDVVGRVSVRSSSNFQKVAAAPII